MLFDYLSGVLRFVWKSLDQKIPLTCNVTSSLPEKAAA